MLPQGTTNAFLCLLFFAGKVKGVAVFALVEAFGAVGQNQSRFYVVLGLGYAAGIFTGENALNAGRQLHIDFADDFFVFNYVYADIRVNKAQNRVINVDDVINFDYVLFAGFF